MPLGFPACGVADRHSFDSDEGERLLSVGESDISGRL